MITLFLTSVMSVSAYATTALESRLRAEACPTKLDDQASGRARDYASQLTTWLNARARSIFPGGLEVDTMNLRRSSLAPDPARIRAFDRILNAVARGRATTSPVSLAQVIVRELNAQASNVAIVADHLTWNPVTGDAATGEFMLIVPVELRARLEAHAASHPLHISAADRELIVMVDVNDTPAARYAATLELLTSVREWIGPARPMLRSLRD